MSTAEDTVELQNHQKPGKNFNNRPRFGCSTLSKLKEISKHYVGENFGEGYILGMQEILAAERGASPASCSLQMPLHAILSHFPP